MYIICVFGCEFRHMLLYVEARGQTWALVLTFTLRKGLLFAIRYSRLVGCVLPGLVLFPPSLAPVGVLPLQMCASVSFVSPGDLNSGLHACIRGKCFNCWDISLSAHLFWLVEVLFTKGLTSLSLVFQQCADSRQHFTLQLAVLS